VAVADHQTAGRGRLGRRWEAPAGANLLVSVLLRPSMADRGAPPLHGGDGAGGPGRGGPGGRSRVRAQMAQRRHGGGEEAGRDPGRVGSRRPDRGVPGGGRRARPQREPGPRPTESRGPGPVPADLGDGHLSVARVRESGPDPEDLCSAWFSRNSTTGWTTWPTPTGGGRLASEYRRVCGTLGRRVTVAVSLDGETVSGGEPWTSRSRVTSSSTSVPASRRSRPVTWSTSRGLTVGAGLR
jgi:hypothetical protein